MVSYDGKTGYDDNWDEYYKMCLIVQNRNNVSSKTLRLIRERISFAFMNNRNSVPACIAFLYSLIMKLYNSSESDAWLKMAIDGNDPDAMERAGAKDIVTITKLASEYGHTSAMLNLCIEPSGLFRRDVLLWYTKRACYHGHFMGNLMAEDVPGYYVCGREYDPFLRHVWTGSRLDGADETYVRKCVELYLNVQHAARRSALCITHVLRSLMGRDLATLLGKAVYATRAVDPEAWLR